MEIQEFYQRIGGDYQNVLCRLPTPEFVLKFVKRFATEKTYSELMDAVKRGSITDCFDAAHKFKGIVANMAFTDLYRVTSALVEQLRPLNQAPDMALVNEITRYYDIVISEIKNLS